MFSFRSFLLFGLASLIMAANVSAQTLPNQPSQTANPQIVQQQVPHAPIQQQQIQVQPIKSPLFGAQGNPAYPSNPNQPQPNQQPTGTPQTPLGANTAQQPTRQPVRIAQTNQPITLYGQGSLNQAPTTMPTTVPQGLPLNINPAPANPNPAIARAAIVNPVVPFVLTPAEQQELDTFLIRWERYSAGIKRYDVDFNLFIYNAAIPGADPNKAHKVGFGYFKYIANPRRFVYVVEGEWQGGKRIQRDGDKNPQVFAEKVIIDEKSVSKYDYNSKTVHQINVPPELIGKGIADSPLPLIFGARANELKRRFSMRVVSLGERIHLYARPLLIEDQQEFKELEILLHRQNLTAEGLKQWGINNKEYNVYELLSPKVNDRLSSVPEDLRQWFAQTIDRDWKREVTDWVAPPPPAPAMQQPAVTRPVQPQPVQPRIEIPLYQAP